jgi:hypothetical protein
MNAPRQTSIDSICDRIKEYLLRVQDFSPGEFHGSFWSEKAYHGPLLDWNAGGSHHHRGCGSAALGLWLIGRQTGNGEMQHRAELAFDWLVSRRHSRGGWFEIQNNEKPSNWENTGLEELSTIETAFAIHGLGNALLNGLCPKKSYMDCLEKAGHWFLSIEYPAGSGVFPHHERSPYNTLNATLHAVESLALIYQALSEIYNRKINIFLQGARRGLLHTLPLQWDNGCFPYRDCGHITINYTSLVLWCMLNTMERIPGSIANSEYWVDNAKVKGSIDHACEFLRSCVDSDGSFKWEDFETSSAKYNIWTYFITLNVLSRVRSEENDVSVERLLEFISTQISANGLPRMRDRGEEITECAFMQADILLFILPFSKYMNGLGHTFINAKGKHDE